MDQDKRRIIIQEIKYWKANRLLPEHYCDFLLNLYGGKIEAAASSQPETVKSPGSGRSAAYWMLVLGIIAIFFIIAFHFNAFPLPMQILSGGIFILLLLILGIKAVKRNIAAAYLSLGAGCFLLLLLGEWILIQQGLDDASWMIGYLMICTLLWTMLGIILRLGFLQFCGWTGMLFVYSWLLAGLMDPLYTWLLQLAWIVWAGLFIALGWLVRERNRSMTRVFFIMGLLSWIAPEIMAAAAGAADPAIGAETAAYLPQVVLIGKILVTGVILYIIRNIWTEWVVSK